MTSPEMATVSTNDAAQVKPKLAYQGPEVFFAPNRRKLWIVSNRHAEGGLPLDRCTLTSVLTPGGRPLPLKTHILTSSSSRMPFTFATLKDRYTRRGQFEHRSESEVIIPPDAILEPKGSLFEFDVQFTKSGLNSTASMLEAQRQGESRTSKKLILVFTLDALEEEDGLLGNSLGDKTTSELRVNVTVIGPDIKWLSAAVEKNKLTRRARAEEKRNKNDSLERSLTPMETKIPRSVGDLTPPHIPSQGGGEASGLANAAGAKRKRTASPTVSVEVDSVPQSPAEAEQRRLQKMKAERKARINMQKRMVKLAAMDPATLLTALPGELEAVQALAAEEEILINSPVTAPGSGIIR